jgi:hypothetical protein
MEIDVNLLAILDSTAYSIGIGVLFLIVATLRVRKHPRGTFDKIGIVVFYAGGLFFILRGLHILHHV